MGMIAFFKTTKPQQFNYVPIFYNEQKELLKEREQQIKQEMGLADDETPRVSMIRGQIRRQYERKMNGRISRNGSLRLAVIFILLCLVAYYLFYY